MEMDLGSMFCHFRISLLLLAALHRQRGAENPIAEQSRRSRAAHHLYQKFRERGFSLAGQSHLRLQQTKISGGH